MRGKPQAPPIPAVAAPCNHPSVNNLKVYMHSNVEIIAKKIDDRKKVRINTI
jgi:biotin synthase-related radical SAM superfamily protein